MFVNKQTTELHFTETLQRGPQNSLSSLSNRHKA